MEFKPKLFKYRFEVPAIAPNSKVIVKIKKNYFIFQHQASSPLLLTSFTRASPPAQDRTSPLAVQGLLRKLGADP